jgi:hypothetical protein
MTKDEGDVVSVLLLPSFSNRRKGGGVVSRYNDVVYRIKIKTSTQYNNINNNNKI